MGWRWAWPVLLGLGVDFLLIYAVDLVKNGRQAAEWWPLVPGAVLVAVGLVRVARGADVLQALAFWWPLLLVVLGVWLLVRPRAAG